MYAWLPFPPLISTLGIQHTLNAISVLVSPWNHLNDLNCTLSMKFSSAFQVQNAALLPWLTLNMAKCSKGSQVPEKFSWCMLLFPNLPYDGSIRLHISSWRCILLSLQLLVALVYIFDMMCGLMYDSNLLIVINDGTRTLSCPTSQLSVSDYTTTL